MRVRDICLCSNHLSVAIILQKLSRLLAFGRLTTPYLISIVCCDKYIWRDVLHRTIHIKIVNFRKFFINHTTDSELFCYLCTDKLILTKIFFIMIKPVIKNCGILYQEIILTSLQSYMVEMRCNGNMSRADVVQDIINNLQFE